MSERVSALKFAQLAGCDEKQVRRALAKGLLVRGEDGLIDTASLDSAWRKPNRRTVQKAKGERSDSSDNAEPTRKEAQPRMSTAHAAALEKKESYNALLKQLEYEKEAGAVVPLSVAEQVIFEEFRTQRDVWLNWPIRVGPKIAAELGIDADKVIETLTSHVHKQISQLGEPQADFGQREG